MHPLILQGLLDLIAVDHIRRKVTALPHDAGRVRVDCARITGLDPVAVAGLWRLCAEGRQRGVELHLCGLPAHLARRLRRHPIMEFSGVEEEIFGNPLATLSASDR